MDKKDKRWPSQITQEPSSFSQERRMKDKEVITLFV
jgi:hypothetical protein